MKRKQNNSPSKQDAKKPRGSKNSSKKKKKKDRGPKSDDFYIVPWSDRSEWSDVSDKLNEGDLDEVIRALTVWRERVPALPVGVETTLALLHALVGDKDDTPEDQCRSMYSLAIIRFLNHISHVATKESGENLPMFRLASHMNVPEWIVDLRHEISHGANLPSIDSLRYAASYIKNWLCENYWVQSNADAQVSMLRTEKAGETKEETYERISNAVSCFLACKVYKLRGIKQITDPEVTHQLPGQPWSVTPKQALGVLKTRLTNFFTRNPSLVCAAIAHEMIPSAEFLAGFSAIVEVEDAEGSFERFQALLDPLVDLMARRGRIPHLCTLMASLHVEEVTKDGKLISALWLDRLISKLEEEEKAYPLRLKKILALIIKNLDVTSTKFLPRLLKHLENKMGNEKITKLEALVNIYTDDSFHEVKVKPVVTKMITLEDLTNFGVDTYNDKLVDDLDSLLPITESAGSWKLDIRGQNFWRQIPLGSVHD